jgi:hypothetical protein
LRVGVLEEQVAGGSVSDVLLPEADLLHDKDDPRCHQDQPEELAVGISDRGRHPEIQYRQGDEGGWQSDP